MMSQPMVAEAVLSTATGSTLPPISFNKHGQPLLNVVVKGKSMTLPLSAVLALLRVNFALSADRAVRIAEAVRQKATLCSPSNESVTCGSYVGVLMDTGLEFGMVDRIGAFKSRGSGIVYTRNAVSLSVIPRGLQVWFKWFEKVPVEELVGIDGLPSDCSTGAVPLYRHHALYYVAPGTSCVCNCVITVTLSVKFAIGPCSSPGICTWCR